MATKLRPSQRIFVCGRPLDGCSKLGVMNGTRTHMFLSYCARRPGSGQSPQQGFKLQASIV
eukprot:4404414-Pleurochrysis_carterae.AAC.1